MADDSQSSFLELDYTGRVNGQVFDTTRKIDAPAGNRGPFMPAIVKLGSGQLIPGLDAFLTGKAPGEYTVTLQPEQAFGKKHAAMLKLVPLTAFGKDSQRIEPGLSVTIGDAQGVVKSVSGGRVVVDFNHPLAGQVVEYQVSVHGLVTAPEKKVASVVRGLLGVDLPVETRAGKTILKLPKGFPTKEFAAEIEKHAGVVVEIEEVELPAAATPAQPHDHAGHDHTHDHGTHAHKH